MTHHYKTKKTLKTKKLTQFLKEFNLPLSPSLGSMISSLGEDNYENWEEKVFVRFNTNQSIDSSWKVLFNLCDPNKLNKFTETFKELLLHISVMEDRILEVNMNDYQRRTIYDQIDDDVEFLSKKFFKCIDPKKFSQN